MKQAPLCDCSEPGGCAGMSPEFKCRSDNSIPYATPEPSMTPIPPIPEDLHALARRISERLFTNGAGDKANRLVLELPGKRDGGGWCQSAVEDQILQVLATRTPPQEGQ